jgi:nucleoside-diphosphate-sugar epimerase
MNILITGIHGFVGNNLVTGLKNKHSIYGLDINSIQKTGVIKTFGWNEHGEIPSIDVIIHLAGKAHDTKNQSKAEEYFDINLGLTQKIVDYFLKSTATKFIFFSTVKAVADSVDEILTEVAIPSPQGPYGESKQAAEQYIISKFQTYCSELRTPNSELKKVYILRPCMIHGPGNKGNLNLLYKVVKKGIPWPLGAYENNRSMVSIDNLTWIIQQLIEKDIEPGIYNIADDEVISTNEIIQLMANSLDKKPRIWSFPKGMINGTASIGNLLHLPLNQERLKKLTESYVVSNKKIKRALSIEKLPITASEGLIKTFNSFKSPSL